MERTIPVCVALVLLIGTGLAAGGERRMRWTRPAGDPYVGDVASAIRRFALPSAAEQRFIDQISRSVVTFEVLRTEVERSTFSRAAKDNILRRARPRSFFTRERLEDLKLPSLLADALTRRIDTSVYKIVYLRRGQECAAMVFGRGRLEQGVTFDPAPGQPEPLRSHQFTVEEGGVRYEIVQPVICDNFCLRRTPIPAARIPEQPAREAVAPQRPARESARVQYHLIPINLFEADAARNVAIVDTIPSRNLGTVRRALLRRRDGLYDGCHPFRVELLNLRFERVMVDQRNGQRFQINNRPEPTDLTPERNSVTVEVCNGQGSVAVPDAWIAEASAVSVTAPGYLRIVSDRSGVVYTCSLATSGRCGRVVSADEAGELYASAKGGDVSHVNFVAERLR